MKKRLLIAVGVFVFGAAVVVAFGQRDSGSESSFSQKQSAEVQPIKIGFIGPLSGEVAALGESALAATELAAREVNESGGVYGREIVIVAEDTGCDATSGTSAVSKLINIDKVAAIIGGLCSSVTGAAAPIAQQARVPLVSYASSAPGITKTGDYIFRTYPSDALQSVFAAKYARQSLGAEDVAVLYVKNDWGQGLRDAFTDTFTSLGGTIVYDEGFSEDTRDIRAHGAKIKDADPNALVFYSYKETAIPGLRQLSEIGVEAPILAGDPFDDPSIADGAGEAAHGVRYTVGATTSNESFAERFLGETGIEPQIGAPQAYDALTVIAEAMRRAKTAGGEKARNELAQTHNHQGASGIITFDKIGDLSDVDFEVKEIGPGGAIVIQ